jgi:hypothetical protein
LSIFLRYTPVLSQTVDRLYQIVREGKDGGRKGGREVRDGRKEGREGREGEKRGNGWRCACLGGLVTNNERTLK